MAIHDRQETRDIHVEFFLRSDIDAGNDFGRSKDLQYRSQI